MGHVAVGSNDKRATPGILLASDEPVTWRELAPPLTAINAATRLNLIVFMAACNGADLLTLIQPLQRAPVRLVVGPLKKLSAGAVETAARAFYRTALRGGNGEATTRAMREALGPGEGRFVPMSAEWMFLKILELYFNEATTEDQIAARVEAYIAPLALARVPPAEMARLRALKRAELRDRRSLFDKCYQTFFFVDLYPENAKRFILSFDRCFSGSAVC